MNSASYDDKDVAFLDVLGFNAVGARRIADSLNGGYPPFSDNGA
jgi:hypothetical protein